MNNKYTEEVRKNLDLPLEIRNEVLKELDAHIADAKDEFSDNPNELAKSISNSKQVSVIDLVSLPSTWFSLVGSFVALTGSGILFFYLAVMTGWYNFVGPWVYMSTDLYYIFPFHILPYVIIYTYYYLFNFLVNKYLRYQPQIDLVLRTHFFILIASAFIYFFSLLLSFGYVNMFYLMPVFIIVIITIIGQFALQYDLYKVIKKSS